MKEYANACSMSPTEQPCPFASFLASLKEGQTFCLLASVYITAEQVLEQGFLLDFRTFAVRKIRDLRPRSDQAVVGQGFLCPAFAFTYTVEAIGQVSHAFAQWKCMTQDA